MNPFSSSYLDTLRFLAAIMVLLSHFAYPRFTDGDYIIIQEFDLGRDAVNIFFVLSGFLITYAATTKDKTWSTYCFNRLTRLYSVVIPAIAITFILDVIGSSFCPDCYIPPWYIPNSPFWQKALQALTFSNEFVLSPLRIGSNGPYWSISYEFAYYAFLAASLFLTGQNRILVVTTLCIIAGPAILVLLPIWWGGVYLYRWTQTKPSLPPSTSWMMILLPPLLYGLALATHIPEILETATTNLFGVGITYDLLRYSNRFVWNNIMGLLCIVHLAGIFSLNTSATKNDTLFLRLMRWGARRSFTLYLVHTPVLQCLDAIFPETMALRHIALLGLTLAVCFIVAELTELRLKKFRELCQNMLTRLNRQRGSVASK